MIKLLLLAVVPFMTEHRNVAPKTEVSTNFYGSVTGIVDNAYIQAHGGGGVDTNAVSALANSAVVTNALTVATTNRVALLESSKADRPAHPVTAGHFASLDSDGNLQDSGYDATYFIERDLSDYSDISFPSEKSVYFNGVYHTAGWETKTGFYTKIGGMMLNEWSDYAIGFEFPQVLPEYLASGDWNTASDPFVRESEISATDPTFSSAVLAVGLNIDTNSVAVLNEIAATFGDFPITGTATTVGGLLAALAAAVAWLKKNKVSSFESVGGASATVENGVAKLNNFFTESNSLLTGTIDDRLPIPLEKKTDSFVAEDGHAYSVTMTGTVTITMPDTTADKAAIFQARFSAAAQQSVEFSTTALVKFDGTDCGIVKAGKDALLSAMWNGEAWDLVWKNQA